jgi:hypothetical protein
MASGRKATPFGRVNSKVTLSWALKLSPFAQVG